MTEAGQREVTLNERGMKETYVLQYDGFDQRPDPERTTRHHIYVFHRRSRVDPMKRDYIGQTEFTYRFSTEKPVIKHYPELGWEDKVINLTEKYPRPPKQKEKTAA